MNLSPISKEASDAVQELKQSHHTVTVFDWDDTLFATSALKPYDEANLIQQFKKRYSQHLSWMDEAVVFILTQALKTGDVFIVTNARM